MKCSGKVAKYDFFFFLVRVAKCELFKCFLLRFLSFDAGAANAVIVVVFSVEDLIVESRFALDLWIRSLDLLELGDSSIETLYLSKNCDFSGSVVVSQRGCLYPLVNFRFGN